MHSFLKCRQCSLNSFCEPGKKRRERVDVLTLLTLTCFRKRLRLFGLLYFYRLDMRKEWTQDRENEWYPLYQQRALLLGLFFFLCAFYI